MLFAAKRWRPICLVGCTTLSACNFEKPEPYPRRSSLGQHAHRAHIETHASPHAVPANEVLENAIIGRDQPQMAASLGEPVEERERGLGKATEYRDRNCSLEVTLYPEVDTRVYRALAYQVTSDEHTPQSKRACIERFAARVRQH
jgi:hypothetical protein